jgi:hypothetical protein
MIDSARRIPVYFGITGLDFRLSRDSVERILWASFFPFAAICAMLTNLSLDLYFGTPVSDPLSPEPVDWQRVQNATETLSVLLPYVSLAVLLFLSISRWNRAEATWMLAIGGLLVFSAVVSGAATAGIRAVELDSIRQFELRIFTWTRWTIDFALLAIGYLFIAHRGLAPSQRRREPRRSKEPARDAEDEEAGF